MKNVVLKIERIGKLMIKKALLAQVHVPGGSYNRELKLRAEFWCEIFAVFENDQCIINLHKQLQILHKSTAVFITDLLGTWAFANQRYHGDTLIEDWKKLPPIFHKNVQESFEYVTKLLTETYEILKKTNLKRPGKNCLNCE